MLDKNGKELMIKPGCTQDHSLTNGNVIQNKYQQRYYEWPCGCTQVHCTALPLDRNKSRGRVARGVDNSPFVKGLFKSDFF